MWLQFRCRTKCFYISKVKLLKTIKRRLKRIPKKHDTNINILLNNFNEILHKLIK